LTTQDSLGVKLDVTKDKVIVSKSTPDIGESREELAAQYNGSQMCIGFNPSYLLDVLKNIDIDTVALELLGPDKPGVIRLGDEYTYVVLPMQLT
jgi:DNA polymerase-3 subunit beta